MNDQSQNQVETSEPDPDEYQDNYQDNVDIGHKHRSCFACYGRKIRCDRMLPCSNCARTKGRCVYPAPEKDKGSKNSRHMLTEVIDRLDRLENLVKHNALLNSNGEVAEDSSKVVPIRGEKRKPAQEADVLTKKSKSTQKPSGFSYSSWELLVGDGGRAGRYINNPVLADIFENGEKSNRLQELTLKSEGHVSNLGIRLTCGLFPTSQASGPRDIRHLHPDSTMALKLWNVYVKNVDPLLKILHIPTTQLSIIEAITDMDSICFSVHALLFAIYFAAVTCLSPEEANQSFGCDRAVFLGRFEQGLDQALSLSDMLGRPDVRTLQAFTIYLTCMRAHTSSSSRLVLIGIAIRIAELLGIHRDGFNLKLTPFETEIRLRLWWYLCLLDSRAPEDHGCEPIVNRSQRLRYPLNINDVEIHPDQRDPPKESDRWTDMTFFLMQQNTIELMRTILFSRPISKDDDVVTALKRKREEIEKRHQWIMEKYVSKSDPTTSIGYTALHHHRMACAKMIFILQIQEQEYFHRKQKQQKDDTIPKSSRSPDNGAFEAACHVLETDYYLQTSAAAGKHAWIFGMYTQWYALVYVLHSICIEPNRPGIEQAWDIINKQFGYLTGSERISSQPNIIDGSHGSIWEGLYLLREKALACSSVQADDALPSAATRNSQTTTNVQHRSSTRYLHATAMPHFTPTDPVPAADPEDIREQSSVSMQDNSSVQVSSTLENMAFNPSTSMNFTMDNLMSWPGWPSNPSYDFGFNLDFLERATSG